MEDGVKEDPAQSKEPKFLGKAGWVKKGSGRLLASYKDRYIHVEKTEIVVYENEDLQNCLERLDLENYDKCHDLKSPFKKKHRLIVIRSPKSGNKVHDVKLQAPTVEEKDAWIKALSDGINRAKNKIFDEVKIDESSNLEHVTRSRPKANRNRRPPTRIHMKEVAGVSSDGILRLDLDLEDAVMPNGTHHASVDGTETPKEAVKVVKPPSSASEAAEKQSSVEWEAQNEPEVSQKKVIKPPMPPTKEAKPSSAPEDEPDNDDPPEKKVVKPPMPPSKEAKPCVEEATEEAKAEMSQKSPETNKKTGPPPTPPNKPSSSSSVSNLVDSSQSRPNSHPPTPPCKEKKPGQPVVEPDQEVQGKTDENKEKGENNKKEATGTAVETDKADKSISEEAVPSVKESEGNSAEGQAVQSNTQHPEDNTNITQPNEEQHPAVLLHTASDTSASSQAEEALPKSEVPAVVVSLNDPATDSLSLSPLLCHLPGEKKKKAEEKSVDSGQHSDDDSEGSVTEDTLAASTAALRGSNTALDALDTSEDDIQVSVSLRPTPTVPKPQVRSRPTPPLKPTPKVRSASIGDLLSDSSVSIHASQHIRAVTGRDRAPSDDVMKLEAEVALEMEKTSELLSRVSHAQRGDDREGMPEDLLAKAMEKLKKADHVLREIKKLKIAKNSSNRKSW